MSEFVSLFAGGGGLDLGLEQAGWSCLFANDIDARAIETLQKNQGRWIGPLKALSGSILHRGDVGNLAGHDILRQIGKRQGDVALLAGGPPCQSWSSAGRQLGFQDPRGQLFRDYIRIARELDVRWLLFENVRGLLTARGNDGVPGSALQVIRMELLRAGWQTRIDLLNAADFGVPQRRVRLFIIGYRTGDAPPMPAPTHAEGCRDDHTPWISLAEALRSIRRPEPHEAILPSESLRSALSALKPGAGVKSPGKKEATRPGGHWGYKQGAFLADPERPARTVTASSQQDWVEDPEWGIRRLTPRECAVLQSFPSDWVFAGRRADQYRLIGNAVPPMLARALGVALLQHVRQDKHRRENIGQGAAPAPLPERLQAAIRYTIRDEARNGASRRGAGMRRTVSVLD